MSRDMTDEPGWTNCDKCGSGVELDSEFAHEFGGEVVTCEMAGCREWAEEAVSNDDRCEICEEIAVLNDVDGQEVCDSCRTDIYTNRMDAVGNYNRGYTNV